MTRFMPIGVAVLVGGAGLLASHLLGPFYTHGDPSYVYLFNSLGVLYGLPLGHTDHPGTTVQELGAVVIFLRWGIAWAGGTDQTISQSVASHTEAYLATINVVLIALNALAAWAASRALIDRTGRVWLTLLVPALLIGSPSVLLCWADVSPEPLEIPIALLAVTLALPSPDTTRRRTVRRGAAMGALLGTGIVTKLTFAPMLLFILALPGVVAMLVAVVAAALSCLVLTMPIWSHLQQVLLWIVKLATHQGWYGEGPAGLASADFLWRKIVVLLQFERFYLIAMILSVAAALFLWTRPGSRRSPWVWFFAVCFAVIAGQLLITAVRPLTRYLVPSLGVSALLIPLALNVLARRAAPAIGALLILGIAAYAGAGLWPDLGYGRRGIASTEKLTQLAAQQNCRVMPHFYSDTPEYAASFGDSYQHRAFAADLSQVYPNFISYNLFGGYFEDYAGAQLTDKVVNLLASGQSLCLLGTVDLTSYKAIDVTLMAEDGLFRLYHLDALH